MKNLRMSLWFIIAFAMTAASVVLADDGVPVIVPSPTPVPTPAIIAGIAAIVSGIPAGNSTSIGLLVLVLGGIIDLIARKWPTAKPRDVLRAVSSGLRWVSKGFVLLSQGAEKIAQIGDRIIGQNVVDNEDSAPAEIK
jgi:hypothetical protein